MILSIMLHFSSCICPADRTQSTPQVMFFKHILCHPESYIPFSSSRFLLPPHFLQLHALSALLLAPTAVSLRRLSSPGKAWVSRLAARSDTRVALQGLLARGGRAVAPGRLEHLVSQVQWGVGRIGKTYIGFARHKSGGQGGLYVQRSRDVV